MALVRKNAQRDPTRGRREQNKLDKRERIRRAALELFTSKGYEASTTKGIARRAKVASGTLFLYAKDKRDLLFLVMHDRLQGAVDAGFASLPQSAPLLDQLVHVFRALFRMYGEHPELAADFVRALPGGGEGINGQAVGALTFGFLHRLGSLVEAAKARGEVDADVQPMAAAGNVFALYYFALQSWLLGYATLEAALEPGLSSALALQIRGFLPRG